MQYLIETTLYGASQLFMLPVLLTVILMFLYAFQALGQFFWQARQRKQNDQRGFDLLNSWRLKPQMSGVELETLAFKRLETLRIVTRVTPMLGLVATMIPMGPALKALSGGQLEQVSDNLTVAFSAVILSLLAASLTYWIVNVKRRWYAEEIVQIEHEQLANMPPHKATAETSTTHHLAMETA
ncbi:MAG: MotA/TolQ/ExbB proton channel family protein [Desulfomicrobium sp.]|jgi:biopolymer transport protein ExbB/TolQ|nr:MotA/TolQ/ExbB proton channel family protein [Desulfomicrobium sp.]